MSASVVKADDVDDKVQKAKEEIKSAGDDNIPVSCKAKKEINNAFEGKTDSPKTGDDGTRMSIDCKTWVGEDKFESLSAKPGHARLYTKGADKTFGLLDDAKQTILLSGPDTAMYLHITNDTAIGLSGSRNFIFRPLKEKTIEKGIVGLLQVMTLLGAEAGSEWHFNLLKDNTPALAMMFLKESNPVLSKYYSFTCTAKDQCWLTARKSSSPYPKVPLQNPSPELQALIKQEVFSPVRLKALEVICSDLTSDQFRKDFETEDSQDSVWNISFSKRRGLQHDQKRLRQVKEPTVTYFGKVSNQMT
jgi:hypothetical protein